MLAILIVYLHRVKCNTDRTKCEYDTDFCTCEISETKTITLICSNFISFVELNFKATTIKFEKIILNPKKPIDLDSSLNFNNIMLSDTSATVHLMNIKSFSYSSSPFRTIKFETNHKKFSNLIISDSVFYFHDDYCKSTAKYVPDFLFSFTENIELDDVLFDRAICPLVFHNVSLLNLIIKRPKKSTSPIRFVPKKINNLNSNIKYVTFSNMNMRIFDTIGILNVEVFQKTLEIKIENSSLEYIPEHTFKNIVNLKKLMFTNVDMAKLSKTNFRWLWSLNGNVSINMSDSTQVVTTMNKQKYFKLVLINHGLIFSDKDFCMYQNFPFEKLIFLLFSSVNPPVCTCTLYWLLKYTHLKNTTQDPDFDHYKTECYLPKCDFGIMAQNCKHELLESTSSYLIRHYNSTKSIISLNKTQDIIITTVEKAKIKHFLFPTTSTSINVFLNATTSNHNIAFNSSITSFLILSFFVVFFIFVILLAFIKSTRFNMFISRFKQIQNSRFENEAFDEISLESHTIQTN